ncbi:hypothetical protein DFH28DRAFT_928261 [Melampsora americana]|nr:hypothetical protein DFH28DRAFT_928261 [Melampsora americana]
MSANIISNVTAALGALTPKPNSAPNEQQSSLLTNARAANNATNTNMTSHDSTNGATSSFSKYNKQMLISNYLNRGRAPPLAGPEKDTPVVEKRSKRIHLK